MRYKNKTKTIVIFSIIVLIAIAGGALALGTSIGNKKQNMNWNDFAIDMKNDKFLPSEIVGALVDFLC